MALLEHTSKEESKVLNRVWSLCYCLLYRVIQFVLHAIQVSLRARQFENTLENLKFEKYSANILVV